MMRQDDVGTLAYEQAAGGSHPARGQCFDLFHEHRRVDDGALADDALGPLMQNA